MHCGPFIHVYQFRAYWYLINQRLSRGTKDNGILLLFCLFIIYEA